MDLGLNIASAGMLAEQVQEDQISNDLANASTPGFKASSAVQQSFGSLLLQNSANGQTIGSIATGVNIGKGQTDLAQGPMQQTGRPLDFAIQGAGFFAVKTANGTQYTRNGQFSVSDKGQLIDQYGDDVLSQTGAPIAVGAAGTVPTSALGVFNVTKPTQLGNNNFSGAAAGGRASGQLYSGQLEGSGIDPIQEMVQMESALNAYTAGQTTIGTISQTMQESAQSVAQVP
ncbi:MAG TPA: flagellar hook-basal body complex protein [Solirubrobacteraceae bacterium]|jgi:flagellar basal-body rod protein FlgG|nr:flagellar hook-basal body complex protein [Solirubrobacteraceae bacterium]